MKRVAIAVALLMAPTMVFAAGFAKQSIFLSTNSPVEGQTVIIHASVANPTGAKFTGKLSMRDESANIGSVPVTLDPGAADDVSISWKPVAGTHTIVADLTDSSGTVVEEDTQVFVIAPKPSVASTTPDVQSSAQIQQSLSNISPAAGKYSAPLFRMIDSGRVFAADELNKGIDWSKQKLGTAPKKSSAFAKPEDKTTSTFWTILAMAVLYILSILLYIVGNAGLIYPILTVVFFYFLWKSYKRYRRR